MNSYAVVLNEQEKINADHFGPFKVLADNIGHKYYDYWTKEGILTAKNVMRMLEVNLVADLMIAMLEGIKSKKQIKKYYDIYESNFDYEVSNIESKFDSVIAKISELYPEGLAGGLSPPAPTPPGMRVRTGRFDEVTELASGVKPTLLTK